MNDGLTPDREYVLHDGVIKVRRYRPLDLQQELTLDGAVRFDPNATYMLTGDLGGLGRVIAIWLAEEGARNLLFLSPTAGTKRSDYELVAELESMQCTATTVQGLVQNEADVLKAIGAAKSKIRGVLHLAMQLRDCSVLDMTYDRWKAVLAPKIEGAWNLHRKLGPDLDFVAMASSLGTVFQQPGQSNYNAANTFLESFCQYRRHQGLAASVLNVCPIEDVGYVAENNDARRKLKSQGHCFLDERALLRFLELSIICSKPKRLTSPADDCAEAWVNPTQIVMGLRSEIPLGHASNHASWRFDRRMGLYHNTIGPEKAENLRAREGLKGFVSRLADHPSLLNEPSSRAYLAAEIGKKIFSFIIKHDEEVDISLTLSQVGLDSLMAIELRRWWKQVFGIEISVLEILSLGTIAGLGDVAVEGLQKKFGEPLSEV